MLKTNEVRIETCTKCNYSCVFCPHSTTFKRKQEVMSYDTFCFIIDKIKKELPEITEVTISGFGEAFLDDTIIEKIRYAKKEGYKIHVLSNGYYLNRRMLFKLNEIGIEEIRISLHSVHADTYRKLTKAPHQHFTQVICNIEHIIYLTDIPLVLTFDIVPGINDTEISHIKHAYDKHATLEIWKPHNWVSTYKYRKGNIIKPTCGRPWNSPYQIQVDGTVNMCCFDYNGVLLLGDFLTQTMEEIFTGDAYLNLKKHHEEGTLDQSDYICADCDQRKSQEGIVLYNNKFEANDRLNRTSTNYAKV